MLLKRAVKYSLFLRDYLDRVRHTRIQEMSRVSGGETGRQALLEAEGAAAAHAAGRRHARCTCTSGRRVVALLPPARRRAVVTRHVPAAKNRVHVCYVCY